MKFFILTISLSLAASFTFAEKNEETISKVMKDGFKGKTSILAKTLKGAASDEEIQKLNELIGKLKDTKAPEGDQAAYDEKIAALIAAAEKVAGGDKGDAAVKALKKASNCKGCHSEHKPD